MTTPLRMCFVVLVPLRGRHAAEALLRFLHSGQPLLGSRCIGLQSGFTGGQVALERATSMRTAPIGQQGADCQTQTENKAKQYPPVRYAEASQ